MVASGFSIEEEHHIEEEFNSLLVDYSKSVHTYDADIVRKAFRLTYDAHRGVRRLSGEPYTMHPIAVAKIVVNEMGLGSTSICCALLHDVVEDSDYTINDIKEVFGDKIARIVDGLTKISGGVFADQVSVQAENIRRLLLTMSDDIRVVLIKIADRLHNMRTLSAQPLEKQYKIAGETLYIYAPLANRLGFFPIKTELEDLSFKYEHPDAYATISKKLKEESENITEYYNNFVQPIRDRLDKMGIKYTLSARIKSVYSIWKKMMAKDIAFEDVYDILAVRIVFTPAENMAEEAQCWLIFAALTDIYHPHPSRIRDWLSTPKANGYEALHVTLMGQGGKWVEVQIRTERMHLQAERGVAAHWKYKDGNSGDEELDKWLQNIKDILEHPEPNAVDFLDAFKLSLFAHEVFVFTPSGEMKTLPAGATALDLAFSLHSEIGEHCIGAKVNHSVVPLSYVLNSGDQVEILTSQSQRPKKEWLEYTTTVQAQSRLRAYFKKEDHNLIQKGEEAFMAVVKQLGNVDRYDAVLQRTLNYFHLTLPQHLFLQIGRRNIVIDDLQSILNPRQSFWHRLNPFVNDKKDTLLPQSQKEKAEQAKTAESDVKKKDKHIILTDENLGIKYVLSDCCHPIPGDRVMGFKGDDGKIYIHKIDCERAKVLKTSQGQNIYVATWDTHRISSFRERFEIRGIDRFGILSKVISIISSLYNINLYNISLNAENGIFFGEFGVYVFDKAELDNLIKSIKEIPEIVSIRRIETNVS